MMTRTHFMNPLLALAAAALVASLAGASEPPRDPQPTPIPDLSLTQFDEVRPGQTPLLREGSAIAQATGVIRRGDRDGSLYFRIDADHEDAPGYTLLLHPNAYMSEIKQVQEAAGDFEMAFALTGRVYVHQMRNYLLLTSPPRVIGHRALDEADVVEEDVAEEEAVSDEPHSARDVMQEMERATGPIARSRAGVAEREARAEHMLSEGTEITMRRGRVMRDDHGAWIFVFDADASGDSDPPLTLLPCRLLERIESYAHRVGRTAPVLISGMVTVHEDRYYLLPTVFMIPRERTELHPSGRRGQRAQRTSNR